MNVILCHLKSDGDIATEHQMKTGADCPILSHTTLYHAAVPKEAVLHVAIEGGQADSLQEIGIFYLPSVACMITSDLCQLLYC